MTAQTFKPGDWVLFRLGERIPETMPCCGALNDSFANFYPYHGMIFQVYTPDLSRCAYCGDPNLPILSMMVHLRLPHVFNKHLYAGFIAYPQECTLVEDPEAKA